MELGSSMVATGITFGVSTCAPSIGRTADSAAARIGWHSPWVDGALKGGLHPLIRGVVPLSLSQLLVFWSRFNALAASFPPSSPFKATTRKPPLFVLHSICGPLLALSFQCYIVGGASPWSHRCTSPVSDHIWPCASKHTNSPQTNPFLKLGATTRPHHDCWGIH